MQLALYRGKGMRSRDCCFCRDASEQANCVALYQSRTWTNYWNCMLSVLSSFNSVFAWIYLTITWYEMQIMSVHIRCLYWGRRNWIWSQNPTSLAPKSCPAPLFCHKVTPPSKQQKNYQSLLFSGLSPHMNNEPHWREILEIEKGN